MFQPRGFIADKNIDPLIVNFKNKYSLPYYTPIPYCIYYMYNYNSNSLAFGSNDAVAMHMASTRKNRVLQYIGNTRDVNIPYNHTPSLYRYLF